MVDKKGFLKYIGSLIDQKMYGKLIVSFNNGIPVSTKLEISVNMKDYVAKDDEGDFDEEFND